MRACRSGLEAACYRPVFQQTLDISEQRSVHVPQVFEFLDDFGLRGCQHAGCQSRGNCRWATASSNGRSRSQAPVIMAGTVHRQLELAVRGGGQGPRPSGSSDLRGSGEVGGSPGAVQGLPDSVLVDDAESKEPLWSWALRACASCWQACPMSRFSASTIANRDGWLWLLLHVSPDRRVEGAQRRRG